jgi:hypothetical protein
MTYLHLSPLTARYNNEAGDCKDTWMNVITSNTCPGCHLLLTFAQVTLCSWGI